MQSIETISSGSMSSCTRFLVFVASSGELVTYQDLPIATICPEGSWAEVDPLQLLSTSIDCINLTVNNLKQLDIDPEDIVSIGLTNQVRVRFLIKLTKFCSNIK